MAQIARLKIAEVPARETAALPADCSNQPARIRVSPHGYLTAVFLTIFFTAFFVYLERDLIAAILFAFGFIIFPLLAWTDRIVFDGETLRRTGLIPRLWNGLNGAPQFLKLADIEQIETQAIRTLKRGGNVLYRYRTSVQGEGKTFVFASSGSGGEDYRQMIRKLFVVTSIDTLDNRSIELRDYLSKPKEILLKAAIAKLPSSDVLENSLNEFQDPDRRLRSRRKKTEISDKEIEKADYMRTLANELRLSGNLLQSLEAFRRALLLNPFDAWMIFEFARCLHSYASSERNEKLKRKARAALRLAEIRAGQDGELLSRLGESYFQYGDWKRAALTFQKALVVGAESFRSVCGLAEVALREGKIAHVIHHFTTAGHFAETTALRRWAQSETRYFSRLNDDDDYMESEVQRMNWLESTERAKKTSLQIAIIGLLTILLGIAFDQTLANIGWACASVSMLTWGGLVMSRNLLAERSPILEK